MAEQNVTNGVDGHEERASSRSAEVLNDFVELHRWSHQLETYMGLAVDTVIQAPEVSQGQEELLYKLASVLFPERQPAVLARQLLNLQPHDPRLRELVTDIQDLGGALVHEIEELKHVLFHQGSVVTSSASAESKFEDLERLLTLKVRFMPYVDSSDVRSAEDWALQRSAAILRQNQQICNAVSADQPDAKSLLGLAKALAQYHFASLSNTGVSEIFPVPDVAASAYLAASLISSHHPAFRLSLQDCFTLRLLGERPDRNVKQRLIASSLSFTDPSPGLQQPFIVEEGFADRTDVQEGMIEPVPTVKVQRYLRTVMDRQQSGEQRKGISPFLNMGRSLGIRSYIVAEMNAFFAGDIFWLSTEKKLGALFGISASSVSAILRNPDFGLPPDFMRYRKSIVFSQRGRISGSGAGRYNRSSAIAQALVEDFIQFKKSGRNDAWRSTAELSKLIVVHESTCLNYFRKFSEIDWLSRILDVRARAVNGTESTPPDEKEKKQRELQLTVRYVERLIDWDKFGDREQREVGKQSRHGGLRVIPEDMLLEILKRSKQRAQREQGAKTDREVLQDEGLGEEQIDELGSLIARVIRSYHGCRFRDLYFDSASEGACGILLEKYLQSFSLTEADAAGEGTFQIPSGGKLIDFKVGTTAQGTDVYLEWHPIVIANPRGMSDFSSQGDWQNYLSALAAVRETFRDEPEQLKKELRRLKSDTENELAMSYRVSRLDVAKAVSPQSHLSHCRNARELYRAIKSFQLMFGDDTQLPSEKEFVTEYRQLTDALLELKASEQMLTDEIESLRPELLARQSGHAKAGQLYKPIPRTELWSLKDSDGRLVLPYLTQKGSRFVCEVFHPVLNSEEFVAARQEPAYLGDSKQYGDTLQDLGYPTVLVLSSDTITQQNVRSHARAIFEILNLEEPDSDLDPAQNIDAFVPLLESFARVGTMLSLDHSGHEERAGSFSPVVAQQAERVSNQLREEQTQREDTLAGMITSSVRRNGASINSTLSNLFPELSDEPMEDS